MTATPAAADTDLREFAEDWLLGLLGPRLGVAISDIDPETPFLDLGIDSIIAGEVALDASSQLPVALSPTMLLDYPTITDLAAFLCENHPHDIRVLRYKSGKGPDPSAESKTPVAPAPSTELTLDATTTPAAPLDAASWSTPLVNGASRVPETPGSGSASVVTPNDTPSVPRPDQAPAFVWPTSSGPARLLAVSASTERELAQSLERLRTDAATRGGPVLDDLCRTSERGDLPYRAAVVASSRDELAQKLAAPPQAAGVVARGVRPKVAFLFTGQGAQYQRMTERLYRTELAFKRAIDQCDQILRPHLDRSLLDLLFPTDGQPAPLDQTLYTQPVTFAVDYALAQLWGAWGIQPDAVIGHSVGEYVAACVSGVFSLEDGLTLIARRARLMQGLPTGGGMLAVRADESTTRKHVRSGMRVSVAALNSPGSVVLAGPATQLDEVAASLRESGVQSARLGVSHAFHSGLMDPVLAPFERCFEGVARRPAQVPLVSNVTGRVIGNEIIEVEYWLRQLRQPVRFADGIRALAAAGITVFLEVGPGATLTALARETVESIGTMGDRPLIVPSLTRGRDDLDTILAALGQIWVRGGKVRWSAVDGDTDVVPSSPAAFAHGSVESSPPESAPTADEHGPRTLFETQIDHARVSGALKGLREGTMSVAEVLAAVRSSTGGGR